MPIESECLARHEVERCFMWDCSMPIESEET